MVETNLEYETLIEAMNYCMASELPDILSKDEERIWVRGLAKVRKNDNSVNWSVVRNCGDGSPSLVADFGHVCTISSILEIRPTSWLEQKNFPSISKKSDAQKYLVAHGKDAEEIKSLLKYDEKSPEEQEECKSKVMNMIISCALADFEKNL